MDITDYINFKSDIDSDRLFDVEQRIRLLMRERWPELDTTPSSPFGNLVLTPIARVIALFEQAADCILGDLNLENALNSIVCDCSFVESFLKGLGINSLAEVNTTATVRLIFNTNQDYYFDQSYPLLFNNEFVFNFIVGGNDNPTITIKSTYDSGGLDRNNNIYKLSNLEINNNGSSTAPNQFFVDIPIYGPASASISSGTEAALDVNMDYIDNIVSAQIIEDVQPLEFPTTIAELAKLCQSIQPSSNLTTKAGVVSYVFNKFPKIIGVSAVTADDKEMKRNSEKSPFKTVSPYLDIYVKGSNEADNVNLFECSEYVRVGGFASIKNADLQKTCIYPESEWFIPQHIPIKFTSASYYDGENESEPVAKFRDIISCMTPNGNGNLNLTEGVQYQVKPDYDVEPDTIRPETPSTSNKYLKISYLYDPLMEAVQKTILGPACNPIINTLIRPFYPWTIEEMKIVYRKETGKFFDRQAAVSDIYKFMNSLTYPLVYDDAYISDIMISNGASGVDSIAFKSSIRVDAADKYVTRQSGSPTSTMITTGLVTDVKNPNDISDNYVCKYMFGLGIKNVQYILNRDAINLVEKAI